MSKPIKLPSGNWRIQYRDSFGRRLSETYSTFDAARAAIRRRETELDDIRAGRKDPGTDATFKEAADGFLALRRRGGDDDDGRRRDRRIAAYESHLNNHLLPAVGNRRLHEITQAVVDSLVYALGEKASARPGEKNEAKRKLGASTIRNILTTFRQVMEHGKRPVTIKLPKELRQQKRRARKRPKYIKTAEEIVRYLEACKPKWFRAASALALYAGLRRGEIASLRWRNVDFKAGTIDVVSSWEGPPKNDEERTVPLPDELADELRAIKSDIARPSAHVILVAGKPMVEANNPCAVLTARACKRAGIDRVTFHDLRSTFGTHQADAGVPISRLRALMGHTDIATTAIYIRTESELAVQDQRTRLSFRRPDAKVVDLRPEPGAHAQHTKDGAG